MKQELISTNGGNRKSELYNPNLITQEELAKENQLTGLKQNNTVLAKLPNPSIDTRAELAKLAGV